MKKIFLGYLGAAFFLLAACASEPADLNISSSSTSVLYSTAWGWDYEHISVLKEGASNAILAWNGCPEGQLQEHLALCADRLVHAPTGQELALPRHLQHARSATAGLTDRLVYLLDARGDIHVLDTRWEHAASDQARLLLWSKHAQQVDILAGNARRHLASVTLSGQLQAWTLHQNRLYVLYRTVQESLWAWGVEAINLQDFSVAWVGRETLVENPSEIPDAIEVSDDGQVRLLRGGCEMPL